MRVLALKVCLRLTCVALKASFTNQLLDREYQSCHQDTFWCLLTTSQNLDATESGVCREWQAKHSEF
jgi:hypothetical protein